MLVLRPAETYSSMAPALPSQPRPALHRSLLVY